MREDNSNSVGEPGPGFAIAVIPPVKLSYSRYIQIYLFKFVYEILYPMKEIITTHVSSGLTTILIAKPEQKLFTVFCQGFIDFSITNDQLLQGHTTKKAEITS